MRRLFGLLLIVGMFFSLSVGEAKVPPKPVGEIYVQDFAGVMDSESKAKILQMGRELEAKSTAQVVVVTVPSLEGQDLQSYSLEILRTWGVGQKDKNNGVVILLAVEERNSRIEVGYGLEGDLPDGKTGRIQDEYMLPAFKEGKYGQGLMQGYSAIATVVAGAEKGSIPPPSDVISGDGFPAWIVLVIIVLFPIGIFFGMRKLLQSFKTTAPSGSYRRNNQTNPDLFGASRGKNSQNWLEIILQIIIILLRGGGRGGRGGGGGFGGGSGGGGGSSRGF